MADQQPDYDLQEIPHDPFAGVDPIVSPAPAAIPRITVHPQSRVQDNLPPGSDLSVGAPVAKQGQTVQPVDIPQGFEAMRSGVAGTLGAVTGLTTPISEMSEDEQKLFALTAGIGMIAPGEGRAAGIAEEAIPAISRIAREAHPGWIDQRMPNQLLPGASSRKGYDIEATFGGNEEPRIVDAETMARNPNLFKKNTDLVKDYPNVRPFAGAPPNQVARSFIGQMADNLVWLYNQIPQEVRDRSKQWYVGGNKVINDWAKQYDLPDTTVAGVTAALSPLSGWYRNVANAQRMLEILKNNTFEWSPEMDTTLRNIPMFEKARYAGAADTARGKSLQDIDQLPLSPEAKAAAKASWVRIYDEAHNPRDYQLWSPEGEQLGPVMSKNTNKPERMAWTFPEAMAKAIQIYDSGGDRNAINAIMGDQHKIRNFYNNLLDPWSPYRDVTIDTHAVAAAHLRPFGGSDLEVAHNFGNTPAKNEYGESQQGSFGSDITGIRGLYPLYADAYRNAAQRLGIMPRELQSITWEGIRGLFPEDWKSVKNSAIIDNIWRQYKSGKVGIDETRQRVFDHAAAERPDWAYPDWWDKQPVSGAHEGNRSAVNTPELSGIGARPEARGEGPGGGRGYGAGAVPPEDDLNPPSVLEAWRESGATGIPFVDRSGAAPRNLSYELDFGAGAPYNAKFPGWSGLSGDQKTEISGAVLPKIVDFAKQVTGAEEAARVTGLGGWHEFTNPAFKSQLNTSPEVAKDVADIIGYLAQQTKMFGYRPSASGDRVGVALYSEGLGDAAKVRELWSRLTQEHPELSAGFSPSVRADGTPGIEVLFDEGVRDIGKFTGSVDRAAKDLGLSVDVNGFKAAEESREHDWTQDPTGRSYLERLAPRYGPDIQQRLDAFAHQEVDPDIRAGIRRAFGSGGLEKAQREAEDAAAGRPKLVGLPDKEVDLNGKPYVPGPIGYIHDLAEKYMKDAALPYEPPSTFAPVDKERAAKIAQAFDDMKHAPDDPKVQASYNALIDETLAQYRAIKEAGIKFDFIKPGMRDPYAENPRLAAQDVLLNKHLWVFPTEGGFGSGTASAEEAMKNNPLLRPTDEYINGHRLLANDVFRIVHDIFGHLKDGNGFRANGEENAWRSHSAMYSDLARPAMTSETRGQNSWVNFGPHGEKNRTASAADTVYADQKIGLLPKWTIEDGRGDTSGVTPVDLSEVDPTKNGVWWHGSASGDLRGGTSGLHLGTKKAATQALEARIGIPADGQGWRGDREYGQTKLAGSDTINRLYPDGYHNTGINSGSRGAEFPKHDFYPQEYFDKHPIEHPTYPDGSKMPLDVKPSVEPYRLTGSMTNTPLTPHEDYKANGYMKAALKRGLAKSGYFYKNVGEDAGSISAVVPNGRHIEPAEGYPSIKRASGGRVLDDAYDLVPVEGDPFTPKRDTGGRVPKDMGPETEQQRIEGAFKDLERQQKNNPQPGIIAPGGIIVPGDFGEPGMPVTPGEEVSPPPWGSGGLRTERQEGGTIPEEQTSDQWRPAGGGEAIVAPALEAANALNTISKSSAAQSVGSYFANQIEKMKQDQFNPFSTKSRSGFAHGGRVDARNVERHPTPAQIAANNYAHDRIHALGLRISIENVKGSYREGVGKDGNKWRAKMPNDAHYGYLLGTTARDLDHLDCFVGPHRLSPKIFVIDQINPDTGSYDEAKCMLFFANAAHAQRAYESSFSDGKGKNRLGKITEMTIPAFKTWLDQGNITKPFKHPLSRKERVDDIVRRHA